MELVNEMHDFASTKDVSGFQPEHTREADGSRNPETSLVMSEAMETLCLLLSPFAPHIADELWETLGKSGSTYQAEWPDWDREAAKEEQITVVVQVNGKVRDKLDIPAGTPDSELERLALASGRVQVYFEDKQVRKVIVVPGRLVNIVVG